VVVTHGVHQGRAAIIIKHNVERSSILLTATATEPDKKTTKSHHYLRLIAPSNDSQELQQQNADGDEANSGNRSQVVADLVQNMQRMSLTAHETLEVVDLLVKSLKDKV